MASACCLGALPLLAANPPATSDGLYHLLRAAELDRQLRAGVPYPRWAPDFYLGYGYPIFSFTPLLPYYLVEAVHLAGPALLPALAAVEALALVASGLLAYVWLRRLVGPPAAAAGAVLYALAPYHLVNLYFRGDLAEFLAAAWFPAILLALDGLLRTPSARHAVLTASAVAALLLTHFLSALLFLPAAALVALATPAWRRPAQMLRQARAGLAAALLGAGLAAFAWLPAVASASDADFGKLLRFYNVAANFATASQLFARSPLQHYTPVFAGAAGFGYQFGLLQSAALLAGAVAVLLCRRRLAGRHRRLALAFAVLAAVSLLGCLRLAAPVWDRLAPLHLVQFPWRLLAIAALPAAYGAALAIQTLPNRARGAVGPAVCLLVALSSLALLRPLRLALPPDLTSTAGIARFELLYHLAGTSAAAEYLPPWAVQRQTVSAEAFGLATGIAPPADPAADVADWTPGQQLRFSMERTQAGDVTLPVLYFPGWAATVDGRPAALHPASGSGLAALALPAGRHALALRFGATPLVRLGEALSLLSLLVAGGMWTVPLAWRRRRCRREPDLPADAVGRSGRMQYAPTDGPFASTTVAGAGDDPGDPPAGATTNSAATPVLLRAGIVALPCCLSLALALLGGHATATGWQPLDVALAGRIAAQGYRFSPGEPGDAGAGRVQAGTSLALQVRAAAPAGQKLALRLTDAAAIDWADWDVAITSGDTILSLPLPPSLPPGLYVIRLGTTTSGQAADFTPARVGLLRLLPVDGMAAIGPIVVMPPAAPLERAAAPVADAALWPGRVALAAPRLPAALPAGETLAATWTWLVLPQWRGERLTESLHLRDSAGNVLAAADTEPAGGAFPTPFWLPGQQLLERPGLAIPADTPPGEYAVSVGLRGSGGALPAQDAAGTASGDEATLGRVRNLPPATPAPWPGGGRTVAGLEVALAQPLGQAVAGRPLHLALRWHLPAASAGADAVEARLVVDGRLVGTVTAPIGSPSFPAARWRPGETERQDVDLPVAGDAPPGPAQLLLVLRSTGTPAGQVLLTTTSIAARPHVYSATPQVTRDVRFAGGIVLLGDDLRADGAAAGGAVVQARRSLAVTLYWRPAGPTPAPLKVTVQVLSASNVLLAQQDTEPAGGAAPSTSWLAGEIVTSNHLLALGGLPPGTDHLIVALYDPKTGRRLATPDGDAVTLATVTVP